MKTLFWSSLFLIFFVYAGYPIFMYLLARCRPIPVRKASIFPTVTILLAAYNEEQHLPSKLANLSDLDYPAERLEVVLVSDGSTDGTNKILESWEAPARRRVTLRTHCGKAAALNCGLADARGEIVVFTDARQIIALDALKNLVANFADPSVGCVSGELMVGESSSSSCSQGVGSYWRLEKNIRRWEGLAGSAIGATGALYAVRKNLLSPIPQCTLLDDVYIPFQVVKQGQRVVFDSRAKAWDDHTHSPKQEFRRKVRTLVGNYQLLQLDPWILSGSNPLRLQFVCHKLLRLMIPFALIGVLVSAVWLRTGIYALALVLQLLFYALGALNIFRSKDVLLSRLSSISLAFIVLNAAAALAFVHFITGRKAVWTR